MASATTLVHRTAGNLAGVSILASLATPSIQPQGGINRASTRYADPVIFDQAPRYHSGGFAGGGLLSDEVPIIARRGELVVPPERIVREDMKVRETRPISVTINVTAADANSFRASQAQIAAEAARAIERAARNR